MDEHKNDNNDREVFRSRYSIILIIILLLPMIHIIYSIIERPNYPMIIGLLILGFVIFIVAGIKYVITDSRLIFKTWFIKNVEISIYSIEKIERTYIPLASNAGSFKRLGGIFKKGSKYPSFFLISPKNEERFLEKLKQINPKIKVRVTNKKGFYRFWDWDI